MNVIHRGIEKSLFVVSQLACVREKSSQTHWYLRLLYHHTAYEWEFIFIRLGYNPVSNIKAFKNNLIKWKPLSVEHAREKKLLTTFTTMKDKTGNNQILKFPGQDVLLQKLSFVYI